ncbi:MAG: helix-turn-helix transcriptional regulator [Clostridiales bacterium]|nr:helix-turn-helix transcriptional regulator [Clostridiales bacterium]
MPNLNMRSERIRSGLSLEQAAHLIGVHPNSLQRWELNKAEPLAKYVVLLASIYHCSVEYLMGLTSNRN